MTRPPTEAPSIRFISPLVLQAREAQEALQVQEVQGRRRVQGGRLRLARRYRPLAQEGLVAPQNSLPVPDTQEAQSLSPHACNTSHSVTIGGTTVKIKRGQ
jgi:hypothetical protein